MADALSLHIADWVQRPAHGVLLTGRPDTWNDGVLDCLAQHFFKEGIPLIWIQNGGANDLDWTQMLREPERIWLWTEWLKGPQPIPPTNQACLTRGVFQIPASGRWLRQVLRWPGCWPTAIHYWQWLRWECPPGASWSQPAMAHWILETPNGDRVADGWKDPFDRANKALLPEFQGHKIQGRAWPVVTCRLDSGETRESV